MKRAGNLQLSGATAIGSQQHETKPQCQAGVECGCTGPWTVSRKGNWPLMEHRWSLGAQEQLISKIKINTRCAGAPSHRALPTTTDENKSTKI